MNTKPEPEPTVLLINRSLPYNCVGRLTGRSGVLYGESVYEEAHGVHVCRLPLAQWRACKEDVTYGMIRRWSQWEVDIEAPLAGIPDPAAALKLAREALEEARCIFHQQADKHLIQSDIPAAHAKTMHAKQMAAALAALTP